MFTDFVYLLLFLLSLYDFDIPFVSQLSHGWPWGFCLWLLRLKPSTSHILSNVSLFITKFPVLVFVGSDGNVLAIDDVKWTIFAVSSHVFFNLGVS
jgi:hypothetical protein